MRSLIFLLIIVSLLAGCNRLTFLMDSQAEVEIVAAEKTEDTPKDLAAEPAKEVAAEPAKEVAAEPAKEVTAEPVTEPEVPVEAPAAEAAAESVAEPAVEPVAEIEILKADPPRLVIPPDAVIEPL